MLFIFSTFATNGARFCRVNTFYGLTIFSSVNLEILTCRNQNCDQRPAKNIFLNNIAEEVSFLYNRSLTAFGKI